MRHHVKDGRDERAHTASHKHVTELRNRRIGEHFLNIVLRETDSCSKQRSGRAYDRDDEHRERRVREDRRAAHDHVNAGSHHGRGVNQR